MRKIDHKLKKQLETLISSMGYELVGCQLLPQGRHSLFRIYIDKPTGITLDDCSLVSQQVSAMMDVEDPIQGKYTLEISSPGIDRPLFEINQYNRYIGSQIKVKLSLPINKRKQFRGTLTRVNDENIFLLVDELEMEIEIPFLNIEKANVLGDIQFQKTNRQEIT